MRSIRQLGAAAAIAVASAFTIVVVEAETAPAATPEEAYQARVAAMKSNGRSASTINKFLRDGVGTLADVQAAVAALKTVAPDLETLLMLFPEGSNVGESKAKPEIWTNWEDFQTKAQALVDGVAAMDVAAASGDTAAIATAFQQLGAACTACHEANARE